MPYRVHVRIDGSTEKKNVDKIQNSIEKILDKTEGDWELEFKKEKSKYAWCDGTGKFHLPDESDSDEDIRDPKNKRRRRDDGEIIQKSINSPDKGDRQFDNTPKENGGGMLIEDKPIGSLLGKRTRADSGGSTPENTPQLVRTETFGG